MLQLVKLNAGHDPNGNPRRGWAVYEQGNICAFFNEGYYGYMAVPERYELRKMAIANCPEINVACKEFNRIKREGCAAMEVNGGEWHD